MDILLKEGRAIPAQRLADAFQVTTRAVRYDLGRLNDYLLQYDLPPLSRNSSGINLQTAPAQNQLLLDLIASSNEGACFFDQRRRLRLIELDLLWAGDFVRIGDLSAKYVVSRSTIISDLGKLRHKRADRVAVRGYPRRGFRVEAAELEIRRAIVACLLDLVPQDEAIDHLWSGAGAEAQSRSLEEAARHGEFTLDDLRLCAGIAARLEKELSVLWSDHSLLRVCYALLICLVRARQGVALPLGLFQEIERTRDYAIVHQVVGACQKELAGGATPADIAFVAMYALGAETHDISYFRKENHIQLELCSARLLRALGKSLDLPGLTGSDELQDNVSEFLSHSFYRIKYDLAPAPLVGPRAVLQGIMAALPAALGEFSDFVGQAVPAAEIEALAAIIYKACALESDGRFAIFKAVVVMSEQGPGRSLYLAALRANFPQIDVTAVLVRHEVYNYQLTRDNLDFIIAGTPLKQKAVPEFIITNMDSARETAELRKYLALNRPGRHGGAYDTRALLRNVLKAAGSVCERETYERFVSALSARVGPVEYSYYRGDVTVMLKDMLQPENISLDVVAEDWEAAVRLCGNILVKRDYVEPRFVEAMVKLVQENGPYIVIAPGLAFPHARPQDGAKVMGLSLIRLREAVEFGNEDNDPVRLVIALSATDSSSHIEALAELFEVISETKNHELLLQAKTPADIISVFENTRARQKREQTKRKTKGA